MQGTKEKGRKNNAGNKKGNRHIGLWFWLLMLVFLSIGAAAAVKADLRIVLGGEILVFLFAALLPFCRRRECLWVSVLTAMVWGPWNGALISEYVKGTWAGCPGWFCTVLWVEMSAMLVCAAVAAFGLLARVIWRHQRTWEV